VNNPLSIIVSFKVNQTAVKVIEVVNVKHRQPPTITIINAKGQKVNSKKHHSSPSNSNHPSTQRNVLPNILAQSTQQTSTTLCRSYVPIQ
jgi:hypothetical protein